MGMVTIITPSHKLIDVNFYIKFNVSRNAQVIQMTFTTLNSKFQIQLFSYNP